MAEINLQEGEERGYTCPKHGEYQGRPFRVFRDWIDPGCPECEAAERERQDAEEAREKAEADKRRRDRRAIIAGIPERFRSVTVEGFETFSRDQQIARRMFERYVDGFADRRRVGGSLILTGKPGTGKTHLMCAAGLALMDRWHILYTDCWTMISAVKATFRKKTGPDEESVIHHYVEPDLLLLDEVGVAYGSDVERAIIHRVLDLRYRELKPTIVAGNLDEEGMSQYLGERAVSRLHENGGAIVEFDWADRRKG